MTALAMAFALLAQTPEALAPDAGPPREHPAPRLSKEDEELVRQMALLEQLDLLKNLDLFEPDAARDDKPR